MICLQRKHVEANNGHRLMADNDELATFTLHCAQGLVALQQITVWLESH